MENKENAGQNIKDEINQEVLAGLAEAFLPKVMPFLTPGLDKLTEYIIKEDLHMFLQPLDGKLYLMLVKIFHHQKKTIVLI